MIMKTEDAITRLRQEGFVAHYRMGFVEIYTKKRVRYYDEDGEPYTAIDEEFEGTLPVRNGEVDGERVGKIINAKRETLTTTSKGPFD
jgi:hypothetical protein